MPTAIVTPEIAQFLIIRDPNWVRFQRFCADLMSSVERVQYVVSALSHDNGRDARTPLISTSKAIDAVVCCSVKDKPKNVFSKAKADLDRLVETGLPSRVALCYTCELQEHHKDQIKEYVKTVAPHCRVRAEGVEFLAPAAARHPEHMENHYGGELLSLRHGMLADNFEIQTATNGLRIAMATQFGEDAEALRLDAMSNLLLLALKPRDPLRRSDLLDRLSKELGLVQRVNDAYFDRAVLQLQDAGYVQPSGVWVNVTPDGSAKARSLVRDARNRLLDGRQNFREELEGKLAKPLSDDVFDEIWVRLQDALAEMFLREGMNIVRAILEPIPPDADESHTNLSVLQKIATSVITNRMLRKDVPKLSSATLSVLTEDTHTRAWLSQVAAIFVSICALGLHPEAQEELLKRMRQWSLVVDNHVVISFVCDAEDDHGGVIRVLNAWRQLGREITTTTAVLEEAAYHAYAAQRLYDEHWRQLTTLTRETVKELIPNAFVRSFHLVSAAGGYAKSRWDAYIQNFRGKDCFDGSALREILARQGWVILDDTNIAHNEVDALQRVLARKSIRAVRVDRSGRRNTLRRNEWDARMAIAAVFRLKKKAETGGNVIIVTQSKAIRNAADWLAKHSVGKLSIMSIGALGYAMALTPGLSISLTHIRELLFDRIKLAQAFGVLEKKAWQLAQIDKALGLDLAAHPQMQERLANAVTEELRRCDCSFEQRAALREPNHAHRINRAS